MTTKMEMENKIIRAWKCTSHTDKMYFNNLKEVQKAFDKEGKSLEDIEEELREEADGMEYFTFEWV